MSEMCRFGGTTFSNEVRAIDLSIRKLQAAYIDTFLFTPFSGMSRECFMDKGILCEPVNQCFAWRATG